MQPKDADVLLAGALLRLDEAGGPVNADDQAARHLRVQCARVAGLVDAQNPLDPRHHLVGAGVGRFVQADEAGLYVVGDVALEWRGAVWEGGVVVGANVQPVEPDPHRFYVLESVLRSRRHPTPARITCEKQVLRTWSRDILAGTGLKVRLRLS